MTLSVEELYLHTIPPEVRLRHEDAVECAALGLSAQEAVEYSVRFSAQAWVALWDGEPVVYGGYSPRALLSCACDVWILGGPKAHLHPLAVARMVQRALASLPPRLTDVHVLVDTEHKSAMKWCKFLGFRPHIQSGRFVEMKHTRKARREVAWAF